MPGIRDIAPKDEDAIATSVAPRTSTISHPRDARFGTSGSDINLPISGGSVTELPATDAWLGPLSVMELIWATLLGMYGASSHSPDKLKAAIVAASVQEKLI